ncbi:hypothetical protein [Fodinibius sediminis]|uniref:Uncharacterized protein n=1 Tax=Fodinibius sediminis TaxID=1214077 RepID=A0A521DZG0_9BACT|nr:hypothetical protein [Fodinibius sediminis]SMO76240.1 hypothetical protein SAMN06265218_11228 [Fodinibius sediminis]
MMNQTIQKTTKKLIDLLPEEQEYYRLDDLHAWGFPPFIVQRIQVELERNLAESMILPKTDWANTESEAVLEAWQQFVQAIRAEARLPASYAKAVIETSVEDTLDMLVQPRENIPDVIFGNDDTLAYEQLCERIKAVVVYPHFATLVPRYMQKKGLDRLSRHRCEELIRRADERLTDSYSPLNWAQMLDPLFNLSGGEIDPSMLRLFFEDKKRERLAETFDQMDRALTRAEFIEVLSAPDTVATRKEVPEPTVLETGEEPKAPADRSRVGDPAGSALTGQREVGESDDDEAEESGDVEVPEQAYPEVIGEVPDQEPKEEPVSSEEEPEHGEDWASLSTSEPSRNGGDHSLNAIYNREEEPLAFQGGEEPPSDEGPEEVVEEDEHAEEEFSHEREWSEETEDEDRPIWMNFMNEEEKQALESEQQQEDELLLHLGESQEESEIESEEGTDDETPMVDVTEEGQSETPPEVAELKEQLSMERSRFIEDLFGGSERAYEEAIQEIAMLSNWRGASRYIQREVFQRNMVDMYSESAIDFTDELHNYFSKK